MAGDWIKMRTDLLTHPKVFRISASINQNEFFTVGALLSFWGWAHAHAVDGRVDAATPSMIDSVTRVPGFAAALVDVGWIEVDDQGIFIPRFEVHNSGSAKERTLRNQRQARWRERKKANLVGTPVDAPVDGEASTREEKRREEKSIKEIHSAVAEEVPIPTVADPPQAEQPKPKREPKPKPEPKPRERDPLFDAVVDATGVDAKTAGGRVGKVCKLLREAEPPYTPEDVAKFARELNTHCDWTLRNGRTRPELGEIEKYIGRIRAPAQPMPPPRPAARGSPADDRTARLHAEGLRALEILASGAPDPFGIDYGTDTNTN